MKKDMDSTAQHVAAETTEEATSSTTTTLQARPAAPGHGGGFKHHLLQVPGGCTALAVFACANASRFISWVHQCFGTQPRTQVACAVLRVVCVPPLSGLHTCERRHTDTLAPHVCMQLAHAVASGLLYAHSDKGLDAAHSHLVASARSWQAGILSVWATCCTSLSSQLSVWATCCTSLSS
jgi:hypothetical protein